MYSPFSLLVLAVTLLSGDPAQGRDPVATVTPKHTAASTLTASITGPSGVKPYAYCSWSSNVSGGTPPYSYQWTVIPSGDIGHDYWFATQAEGSSIMTLDLLVTDAQGAEVKTLKHVNVASRHPACS